MTNKMIQNLNSKLNIDDGVEVIDAEEVVETKDVTTIANGGVDEDYEFTRANLHKIIEDSQEALVEIQLLAKTSQDPRVYKSLSGLLEQVLSANQALLELAKTRRDVIGKHEEPKGKQINNNVFIGTSADLQKLLNSE